MKPEGYQKFLIVLLGVALLLFGVFCYKELFPQYKVFQERYVAMEEFRSTYTGEQPPPFPQRIQQIVIPKEDKGPETIDRCTSCHVALKLQHFSPTKLARDINGAILFDENGLPRTEKNENYVWSRLDQTIAKLRNGEEQALLRGSGKEDEADERLEQAKELERLKFMEIDGVTVDMTKVLAMHPLMGKETRPFELHPDETFGCTSCHGGNGRGITVKTAHGPVFDGTYEKSEEGHSPALFEEDEEHDPTIAKVFTGKPGHELLFQTTPIFVEGLMQSSCAQCHESNASKVQRFIDSSDVVSAREQASREDLETSLVHDAQAALVLMKLQKEIQQVGVEGVKKTLQERLQDYTQKPAALDRMAAQLRYLSVKQQENPVEEAALNELIAKDLAEQAGVIFGGKNLISKLATSFSSEEVDLESLLVFLEENQASGGAAVKKYSSLVKLQGDEADLKEAIEPVRGAAERLAKKAHEGAGGYMDQYLRGKELYLSQACYACHKITGLSKGSMGPELTTIGLYYPWYIKEAIVWPQSNLKTSNMPNFHFDHEEVGDLLTFLLAQRGRDKIASDVEYELNKKAWEQGKAQPWEEPLNPVDIESREVAAEIFATEGCASCHRLRGPSFGIESSEKDREWFAKTFPENVTGEELIHLIEEYGEKLEQVFVATGSGVLDAIDAEHPETIEAYYTPFKFASRAKGEDALEWKGRVDLARKAFVQEYGLGRLIAPRLDWSGVHRSSYWLMEHFKQPALYTPRSLMPVFPFDTTKFTALTLFLQETGKENVAKGAKKVEKEGFDPAEAYAAYCASCHGGFLRGDGPVARWIYPIPKNLKDITFLRNLTKAEAIRSIKHGVKGTPMPPWGEAVEGASPVLQDDEIRLLVDWLYQFNERGEAQEVAKWSFSPQDVMEELKDEGESIVGKTKSVNGSEGADALFDEKDGKVYLSQDFYTEENIEAGKKAFVMSCAQCHGKDATGSSDRASNMVDAKPRMLTNFQWLREKSDLRLLRSIKYGVQGTSMTPWGDKTSTLQRLQLVAFIRSLTDEKKLHDILSREVYAFFAKQKAALEEERTAEYVKLLAAQEGLEKAQKDQESLFGESGEGSAALAADTYKKYQKYSELVRRQEAMEALFVALQQEIELEQRLYERLGGILIGQGAAEGEITGFIQNIQNGQEKEIVAHFEKEIASLRQQEEKLSVQFPSAKRSDALREIKDQQNDLTDAYHNFVQQLAEARRSHEQQGVLWQQIKEMIKGSKVEA